MLYGEIIAVCSEIHTKQKISMGKQKLENSFISTNLIHNSYINYIELNASACFERHPPILRRSMSLIVHVCSLWYSHPNNIMGIPEAAYMYN